MVKSLITVGTNAKTVKSDKASQYLTGILYMMPTHKTCANAKKAKCAEGCLVSAGRGKFNNVQQSRKRKTDLFFSDREAFKALLVKDVEKHIRKCNREGKKPSVRLNGTSDINYQALKIKDGKNIMELYPAVQFYDYTKMLNRISRHDNYHLTYSYSRANEEYAKQCEKAFGNLAVVFRNKLPETFLGRKVIDGDKTDLRFLDPENVIVGLIAKGKAKKDTSGFVIDID